MAETCSSSEKKMLCNEMEKEMCVHTKVAWKMYNIESTVIKNLFTYTIL